MNEKVKILEGFKFLKPVEWGKDIKKEPHRDNSGDATFYYAGYPDDLTEDVDYELLEPKQKQLPKPQ